MLRGARDSLGREPKVPEACLIGYLGASKRISAPSPVSTALNCKPGRLVTWQLLHEDEDQKHPVEYHERRLQRPRLKDRQHARPHREEQHPDRHEQRERSPIVHDLLRLVQDLLQERSLLTARFPRTLSLNAESDAAWS